MSKSKESTKDSKESTDEYDFSIEKVPIPFKEKVQKNKNHEVLFECPARVIVSGASKSGKTNFIVNILTKEQFLKGYFDLIVLVSPSAFIDEEWTVCNEIQDQFKFESLDEKTLQVLDKIFITQEKLVLENKIDKAPKLLFIFDDIISNEKVLKSPVVSKIVTRGRHIGASIIISSQGYKKVPKIVRINCTNLFIFGTSNMAEKKSIAEEQANPMLRNINDFYELFDYATSKPYSFMSINNQSAKKHQYRKNLNEVLDLEKFLNIKKMAK